MSHIQALLFIWFCCRSQSEGLPLHLYGDYHAIANDDSATVNRLIDEFFLPYLAIRNRKAGYAVSIVKAGARLVGHDAGPVRSPLVDCTEAEHEELRGLIQRLGQQ